ncbi:MAG TPA: proteasome subunit beta [Myxococcota bacterium]|nr:proteasome subunit beta [Myxococcota bacterium]
MLFGSNYRGSSFSELLDSEFPHLRLDRRLEGLAPNALAQAGLSVPHGTTVLALKYQAGVVVAGDRLATEGYRVASRDVQKVYATDDHSLIAIAGAAGPCIEMAKLLRVELEHYAKIEGEPLELEGKANKLSQMIRANLPAAMQGLVVVPIFAGYDPRRRTGRVWKYDVTGGRYEEAEYESSGSGSLYAKESLKKAWKPGASREAALRMAVEALTDAADEDRGTGGIDLQRGIFPTINVCSAEGVEAVPETEIAQIHRSILESRRGAA